MSALLAVPYLSGGALIASPSTLLREQVVSRLNGRCRPVQQAIGGAEALVKLEKGNCQVLFIDRRLPDLNAEELTAIIRQRFPAIQVVMLDSDNSQSMTDEHDVVENTRFPEVGIQEENASSPQREYSEPLPGMIGASDAMQRVARMVRLVAPRTTTVLVAGPTGSGKELVSRALHALSPRASKPLVVVNCAAIPEALLASALFGYMRGAFSGAVQSQMCRISAADGGTLFLDEISELPLSMQAKLLRFLEQKEVQRLGSTGTMHVDVRVVAASNVDLASRTERREFREDLFYRISAFPIEVPPLAERRIDILPLAEHFLACMAAAMNISCPKLSADAAGILEGHLWKGNVRELQHVIERAAILAENHDTILAEHLYFPYLQSARPKAPPYQQTAAGT